MTSGSLLSVSSAVKLKPSSSSSSTSTFFSLLTTLLHPMLVASTLLAFEAVLLHLIIQKVAYTEIDWVAYMQEVGGYKSGERDYLKLKGDTGPLVYPAGFLYAYDWLRSFCGGDPCDSASHPEHETCIRRAQHVFLALYLVNSIVCMKLYHIGASAALSPFTSTLRRRLIFAAMCVFSCLSRRVHSLFVLRLFNDCLSATLHHVAILLLSLQSQSPSFSSLPPILPCVVYSLSVSVKMSTLLTAPALLLILLQWNPKTPLRTAFLSLSACAIPQLVLGAPFLLTYPVSYLRKSFELDRVFFYKWTVNLKFLPEPIFLDKKTSLVLLALHLFVLFAFLRRYLLASSFAGHPLLLLASPSASSSSSSRASPANTNKSPLMNPAYAPALMLTANFVGVVFARTLHYQFYAWYFNSLPMLSFCIALVPRSSPLSSTSNASLISSLVGLGAAPRWWSILCATLPSLMVEVAFNVFPATCWSSSALVGGHMLLLVRLWEAGTLTVRQRNDDYIDEQKRE